jgi:hypothetical protein
VEPIISLLEKKNPKTGGDICLNLIDDLTSIDPIHKSTLLDANICIERVTTETKVRHETTDEQ